MGSEIERDSRLVGLREKIVAFKMNSAWPRSQLASSIGPSLHRMIRNPIVDDKGTDLGRFVSTAAGFGLDFHRYMHFNAR